MAFFRLPRLDVAVQRFELGQYRPHYRTFVVRLLRIAARNRRIAADLAVHGFQEALHPLNFTGEFRLLLAGKLFLPGEGFGLFGRAAAHCVQLVLQGGALLEPLGLLLFGVLDEVGDLRIVLPLGGGFG